MSSGVFDLAAADTFGASASGTGVFDTSDASAASANASEPAPGISPGRDGVGIDRIAQSIPARADVILSDGRSVAIDLPSGPAGGPGVGIATIAPTTTGAARFGLTDGRSYDVPLPQGPPGPATAINATFTVSTAPPSGGSDGDVWFQINPY